MSDNKELVWVEKEFAEKYKALEGKKETREMQIAVFEEYMNKVQSQARSDFKANLETLDEDSAIFSGLMLKVKQSFEKAKNEQLDASYAIWEKFDLEIPNINKKTGNIIKELTPLKSQLTEINELMGKIQTYNLDKLLESMQKLRSLYGDQKEMFEFLVNNFKK